MRTISMACLALLAVATIACTDNDLETDIVDDGPAAPMVNLFGEWWLPAGDRLPTQGDSWCTDLTPSRFDDTRCFTEPVSCEQGVLFHTPGGRQRARWLVIIQATECNVDLPVEVRASNAYGFFEWLGRTDDGQADRFRVNAREWTVRASEDEDAAVVESDGQQFTMVEDYRWED